MKRNQIVLLVSALACLLYVPALADEPTPPPQVQWIHERPNALGVLLETNGTTFAQGQAILLRITLSNHADVGVAENLANAWYMFDLKVVDDRGDVLKPNTAEVHRVASVYSGRSSVLWPGDTWVVGGETQDKFSNLQAWGYNLAPGDYRITAYQAFGNGAEVISNAVTINIH